MMNGLEPFPLHLRYQSFNSYRVSIILTDYKSELLCHIFPEDNYYNIMIWCQMDVVAMVKIKASYFVLRFVIMLCHS